MHPTKLRFLYSGTSRASAFAQVQNLSDHGDLFLKEGSGTLPGLDTLGETSPGHKGAGIRFIRHPQREYLRPWSLCCSELNFSGMRSSKTNPSDLAG